jgi:hypothetical protein
MSNSTASITSPSDFIVLKTQTVKNATKRGVYPIYIRGVSQCCFDANKGQTVTKIVIPVK